MQGICLDGGQGICLEDSTVCLDGVPGNWSLECIAINCCLRRIVEGVSRNGSLEAAGSRLEGVK